MTRLRLVCIDRQTADLEQNVPIESVRALVADSAEPASTAQFSFDLSCCSRAAAWCRAPPSGARTMNSCKRLDRGAHIAEPRVEHPRLVPQPGKVGRQQQHRLHDAQRRFGAAGLQQPRLDVVLQPQQHVAVGNRRVMRRRQLDILPRHRLQQLAQARRVADPAVVERIEDQPLGAVAEPDQEMSGESPARRCPSPARARRADRGSRAPPAGLCGDRRPASDWRSAHRHRSARRRYSRVSAG